MKGFAQNAMTRGLWRYRWHGFLVMIALAIVLGLWELKGSARYRATAIVATGDGSTSSEFANDLPNLGDALAVDSFVNEIVDNLEENIYAFSGPTRQNAVDYIRNHIRIEKQPPESGIANYEISTEHPVRAIAVDLVQQTVSQLMNEQVLTGGASGATDIGGVEADIAAQLLRIDRLEARLNSASDSNETDTNKQPNLRDEEASLLARIANLSSSAQRLRNEAAAARNQDASNMSQSDVREYSALQASLDELKRQEATLLVSFTERHPDVLAVQDRIVAVERQIAAIAPGARSLTKIYSELDVQGLLDEASRSEQLAESLKVELRSVQEKMVGQESEPVAQEDLTEEQLQQLENELRSAKDEFAALLRARDSANAQRAASAAIADSMQVVSATNVQAIKRSQRTMTLFGIVALSVLAGLLASYILERRRGVIHSVSDISNISSAPVLASLGLARHTPAFKATWRNDRLFGAGLSFVAAACILVILNKDQVSMWVRDSVALLAGSS